MSYKPLTDDQVQDLRMTSSAAFTPDAPYCVVRRGPGRRWHGDFEELLEAVGALADMRAKFKEVDLYERRDPTEGYWRRLL